MESDGYDTGFVTAPTTPRRLSSRHSPLRNTFISSDLADGPNINTTVNQNSDPTSSPRPISNLTFGDVLNTDKKSPPHNNVVLRTLYEIIRNGETVNIGGESPSRKKKSWKCIKEKLKLKNCQRQGQNQNSRRWTSSIEVPRSDVLPRSRSGRDLMTNRNSRWNSLRSNSIRRIDTVPADDVSLMEIDSGGSPKSEGRRLSRGPDEEENDGPGEGNRPVRISLLDLLQETDRRDGISVARYRVGDEEVENKEELVDGMGKGEFSCCVCMVRHKGAAFIPCGHTFCRLCSKELFTQRGNCPLCNNFIVEVLHIF